MRIGLLNALWNFKRLLRKLRIEHLRCILPPRIKSRSADRNGVLAAERNFCRAPPLRRLGNLPPRTGAEPLLVAMATGAGWRHTQLRWIFNMAGGGSGGDGIGGIVTSSSLVSRRLASGTRHKARRTYTHTHTHVAVHYCRWTSISCFHCWRVWNSLPL